MENKNEVMVFNNEMFGDLRVVIIDNKEYFVGIDIAKALDYSNASKAVSTHCKHSIKRTIDVRSQNGNSHSKSRNTQEMTLITEGDIYRLIIKSHMPEAERFERWVFDEVLPQIRQTGGYIPIKEEDDELTIMSKAFMIAQKTIDNKQQQIEQQQQTINEQQQVIESQRPKADYYDTTLCPNKLITTTDIAKDLGMTAIELNKILVDKKILYKYGKTYYPYAKYNFLVKEKYCDYVISEHSQFLKWTEKGREWIIKIVNENDNKSVDIIVE